MEILLAILLYLNVIFSPGTYNQTYIDQLEINNKAQINAVQADPVQMEIVSRDYLPQVEHVIVINDHQTD